MSFVLYVLAFIMVVMGGPALVTPKRFMKVIGGIAKNSDMIRMMGMRTMFLAFFFLAMYPLLKGGRLMIISILGRLMLLKGLVAVWFPMVFTKQINTFFSSKKMVIIMGIVSILLAAFFVWVGIAKF